MKILISDPISNEGIAELQKYPELSIEINTGLSSDQLVEIIKDYHALIVRSETKVTKEVIANADKLIIIGRAGVGVDNIDVEAATAKGILVVNSPEGNTYAAAEHTMAMLMCLARNVPQANQSLKDGKWNRKQFMGIELKGKSLGVLGLGKIGTAVAKRAKAFDMIVLGYDPYVSQERAKQIGVELTDLNTIYASADFITVHLPLTEATKNVIDERAINKMKPGVRLLNVARGGIIDENALASAIKDGKIAGAALDVFVNEPCTDSPLFQYDNVIVTPHLGASTNEAQINVAIEVAQEVANALCGFPVKNAVNIPSIKPELLALLEPYLTLTESLGKFIAQVVNGPIRQMTIAYNGEIAGNDLTALSNSFLKGFLKPALQEAVNYVNAPILAKDRGIKFNETKSLELNNYANLISINAVSDSGNYSVGATVLTGGEAHLVNINGYSIDAKPEGHMLVIPHMDRPRIIGPVGIIIGNENINIAGMQVGRKIIGGEAVMVLNIDTPVTASVIDKIRQIDGVLDVKYVHL